MRSNIGLKFCFLFLLSLDSETFLVGQETDKAVPRDLSSNELKEKLLGMVRVTGSALKLFSSVSGGAGNIDEKLKSAADHLIEILYFEAAPEYKEGNAQKLASSNSGLRAYLTHEILKSEELQSQAIEFLSLLQILDDEYQSKEPTLFDRAPVDIWELALRITKNSKRSALLLIALFGHNDRTEDLVSPRKEHSEIIQQLNALKPKRNSILFFPGSLAGVVPSAESIKNVSDSATKCNQLGISCAGGIEARYYHILFSAFLADELIYKGDDFSVPVFNCQFPEFATQKIGDIYKKQTIFNHYMTNPDSKKLYELGYSEYGFNQKNLKPSEWSSERYEKAKAELDFFLANLELGKSQYEVGSKFGAKQMRAEKQKK